MTRAGTPSHLKAAGAQGSRSPGVRRPPSPVVRCTLTAADPAWEFPTAAVLSGLFVALVIAPQEPPLAVAVTSGLAVVGRQLFRTQAGNTFNAAALALSVSALSCSK